MKSRSFVQTLGATDDLRIDAVNVDMENPRTISTSQEPFVSLTPPAPHPRCSHSTFMAEVCTGIMNNRSIVPVSVDSGSPYILTPATLLT